MTAIIERIEAIPSGVEAVLRRFLVGLPHDEASNSQLMGDKVQELLPDLNEKTIREVLNLLDPGMKKVDGCEFHLKRPGGPMTFEDLPSNVKEQFSELCDKFSDDAGLRDSLDEWVFDITEREAKSIAFALCRVKPFMTVGRLRRLLEDCPDDMSVIIRANFGKTWESEDFFPDYVHSDPVVTGRGMVVLRPEYFEPSESSPCVDDFGTCANCPNTNCPRQTGF